MIFFRAMNFWLKSPGSFIRAFQVSLCLAGFAGVLRAEKWTSMDGREIDAEFVRMENESVVLRMKGQEHKIPIVRLSDESIKKAKQFNEALEKQAEETANLPLVEEELLVRLLAHSPGKFEGRNFLLTGKADKISLPDGTPLMAATRGKGEGVIAPGHKVQVTFTGGSKATFDFTTKVGSHTNPTFKRQARIEVNDNKAMLMTLERFMNNNTTWQPKEDLLESGKILTVHASVFDGVIKSGKEATPQEVHLANMKLMQMKK
jgi:hypothetical protein